jgi:hypothetical protein
VPTRVCAVGDIAPQTGQSFEIDGRKITIFNTKGTETIFQNNNNHFLRVEIFFRNLLWTRCEVLSRGRALGHG